MGKRLIAVFTSLTVMVIGVACVQSVEKVESGDSNEDKVLAEVILAVLESQHYKPHAINDEFSQKAFDEYLKNIDSGKRFLLKKDFESLKEYRNNVDDQLKSGDFELLEKSVSLLDKRTKEVEKFFQKILEKPLNLEDKEYLEFDSDKLDYCENMTDLKDRWRKVMEYQVLNRIDTKQEELKTMKEDGDTAYKEMTFDEIEEWAREKVLKSNNDLFKRLNQLDYLDRRSVFINSVTALYDPHTGYFPPKDKENFDIGMSGQLEGIGATLQSKDGYIKVMSIVPGSASWKQGELEEGDLILKVAQGTEDPVDIVDMRLDDAVKLIRGKKGTEVRLTVKKRNGDIKIIPIIRDVVVIEAGYAKSSVIERDGKKLGLIHLPKFYADFGAKDGRSCAKDVAKELKKLKSEKVEGVVIDLRNNGGGSLQDVVEMMGLFIAKGPVVQVKSVYDQPRILKDNDLGSIVYDGPLFVLVNENSASASEILAAAIQDYKRGIVIGSKSTFGKGTVQQFFDLNRVARTSTDIGAIKLTTQKFYRINGGATQLKGVTPDIILPDLYMHMEIGERELDYALEWDEIDALIYNDWFNDIKLDSLKTLSKARIDTSSIFGTIENYAKWLEEGNKKSEYPINKEEYFSLLNDREEKAEVFEKIDDYRNNLTFEFTQQDYKKLESDSANLQRYNDWIKNLKSDPYINETFEIFEDLTN